jgi:anti-sigma factor RsiW
MKPCVRFAPMIGSRPGELPAEDARALAAHLETCPDCRALSASLAATDGLLAEALLARANARDFAPFVDQVMARVGPSLAARPRRASARPSVLATLREHWRYAVAAGGLAAVLAGVFAFRYVHGQVEEPERIASLQIELQGGSTVLQTSDGPVVLLAPDDDTGS